MTTKAVKKIMKQMMKEDKEMKAMLPLKDVDDLEEYFLGKDPRKTKYYKQFAKK